MVPTLAVSWSVLILGIAFLAVSGLMVLIILIQRPRGGGLAGAFGGAGGSVQSAFGAKTGDFLTWFTVAMFVCFIFLAMGMQWTISGSTSSADSASATTGRSASGPGTGDTLPVEADVLPAESASSAGAESAPGQGVEHEVADPVPQPPTPDD